MNGDGRRQATAIRPEHFVKTRMLSRNNATLEAARTFPRKRRAGVEAGEKQQTDTIGEASSSPSTQRKCGQTRMEKNKENLNSMLDAVEDCT